MHAPSCSQCSAQTQGPFACLGPRLMARLMEVRVPHTYEPGQHLYLQGNPALAVYCLREGRVKLSQAMYGGGEHVIGTRGPGSILGYRAILTGKHYRVSAVPIERTVACAIPREAFMDLIREDHALTSALLVRLAGESIASEENMLARTVQRVRTRVARFLLQRLPADRAEERTAITLTLPLSREEIALLIDTTRETLSRTFHALSERGIIETDGHDIRILDRAALERLARFEPSERPERPSPR